MAKYNILNTRTNEYILPENVPMAECHIWRRGLKYVYAQPNPEFLIANTDFRIFRNCLPTDKLKCVKMD